MEFLGSNEEGIRVKGLYRGAEPVARVGGDRPPVSPVGGAPSRGGGDRPPLPPRAPGQGSLCKFEEKNYIKVLLPPTPTGDRGIFSKFFETGIYF